jgi:hypothetical protein
VKIAAPASFNLREAFWLVLRHCTSLPCRVGSPVQLSLLRCELNLIGG